MVDDWASPDQGTIVDDVEGIARLELDDTVPDGKATIALDMANTDLKLRIPVILTPLTPARSCPPPASLEPVCRNLC